jgi:rSAM/selenodomain-associated transferase 2
MLVSVIIPALNEERYIANTLQFLSSLPHVEIIVVDGGSADRTMEIARQFTEYVFLTHPGRAHQMNFGAQHATGDVLLFLHADTVLLPGAIEMVRYQMRRVNIVGGAFDLHLDCDRSFVRLIERLATWRSRLTRVPYGDQGIFVRSRVFQHLHGFRPLPVMEDMDLTRRMRRVGKIVFISDGLVSSARRWADNGVFKTTAVHLLLRALYLARVSPHALARLRGSLLKRATPPPAREMTPPRNTTPKTTQDFV